MVAQSVAGHSKFCPKGQHATGSPGQNIAAQVLPDLQRKGPCGKEAFLLKAVWLLWRVKVTASAAIERRKYCVNQTYYHAKRSGA
jgi:hypothetical protein